MKGVRAGMAAENRAQAGTIPTTLVVILLLTFVHSPLFAEDVAVSPEGSKNIVFEDITLGLDSAYPCRVPTLIIVRDREDWEWVWRAHQGKDVSRQELPEIDFDLFSVTAFFAGRSNAVEAAQIVRFSDDKGERLTVHAVTVEPGFGCTGPRVFKNPYHIVRIPAVEKNVALSLEIEILMKHCQR